MEYLRAFFIFSFPFRAGCGMIDTGKLFCGTRYESEVWKGRYGHGKDDISRWDTDG